ncbi:hypothetical protein COLO4_22520 [Corchorus olitorius]|uniref:Uncharacterized protein n=1 Tax=Corchorus olitorius TaxID=93759 RepID=A0A1R3ILJ8_9ROSI|nr:hypothetical protein COLO4_22520 [Corchorus olitorius]
MAGSSPINVPVRSISLPSRLLPNSIEAELNELKTFSTTNHADGEAICTGFTRLAELYNNIEEIIQTDQKALHHQQNIKLVEEALDDSVGLLDACGNARDLIMMMKEQVQELQSALRRKGRNSSIETNIHEYISFRKKLKKKIAQSLKTLKKLEGNSISICSLPVDCHHVLMVVKALRESNAIAVSMFRSFLCFLSMPVMKTKAGGWSLISKLMPERSCQKLFNEVGIVDFTLSTLQGKVGKNIEAKIDAQIQVRRLETLCATIKCLEQGLDGLFRCLIRNRVSLLNVITP